MIGLGLLLSGCGSSLIGSASTTPVSTSTLPTVASQTAKPLNGEVAVAFPVVACTSSTGLSLGSEGWKPTILLAPIPTSLVGQVEFYSDGVHTVLGPAGWTCAQSAAHNGISGLVVYPPGTAQPPVATIPAAGTDGIFALYTTTGNAVGIALVCPFFTIPSWQKNEARCSGSKPFGEQSSMPTPDVASITDPAGVSGSLEGSGGDHPVTGTVIFPQSQPAVTDGSSVNIVEESCSLTNASLCPTVLSDFQVREFPAPVPTYSSGYSNQFRG